MSSKAVVPVTAPLGWQYAPSRESSAIVSLKPRYGLFIDGKFRAPLSKKHFPTINPATEEELAEVAEAGAKDVDRAVSSARRAFVEDWSVASWQESGPSFCFESPAWSKRDRASWRSLNLWTAASRSASRGMSISRS